MFFVLLSIAWIILVNLINYYGSEKCIKQRIWFQEKYKLFNESNINGKLIYVKVKYKLVSFKVDNDSMEYYFSPKTEIINQKKIFNYIAEVGDRIVKPALSDTLQLIKNNGILFYRFRKSE